MSSDAVSRVNTNLTLLSKSIAHTILTVFIPIVKSKIGGASLALPTFKWRKLQNADNRVIILPVYYIGDGMIKPLDSFILLLYDILIGSFCGY